MPPARSPRFSTGARISSFRGILTPPRPIPWARAGSTSTRAPGDSFWPCRLAATPMGSGTRFSTASRAAVNTTSRGRRSPASAGIPPKEPRSQPSTSGGTPLSPQTWRVFASTMTNGPGRKRCEMSPADFITFCGANRDTILGLNGLLSAIMATVLLWLHYRVLPEQKWAKYFGWGFAIFALQYLLPWITHLGKQFALVIGLKGSADAIVKVGDFTQDLGSIFNNILFFMAASALLALAVRFTYWVVGVSVVILVLSFMNLGDWGGIPDKALAFLCLALLGWGFFLNIRVLLSRGLAALFAAGIWLYAVINLLYALIPFIVHFNW